MDYQLPSLATIVALFASLFFCLPLVAQTPVKPKVIREIFVPFDDLNVLLENQAERIFLPRKEYDELLDKAKKNPTAKVPRAVSLIGGGYSGAIADGRATITGELTIEVLEDGLYALPLDIRGVGIRKLTIDGDAAAVGINEQRHAVLFVQGKGRKKVTLDLVAPLSTSAALQSLSCKLPVPPGSVLKLTVPGNVEVKSGIDVLHREVDEKANQTKLELVPRREPMQIVMTLNNRQLLKERAVLARSVMVDEMTQAYERLHATVSLDVLHGAIEKTSFALPDGFDVTEVAGQFLSRWAVTPAAEGKPRTLEVTLREPTTETVVLNITAARSSPKQDAWSMPRLEPLDVSGQSAVVGLLVEERLATKSLASTGLIPVDTAILTQALPASVFEAEPGAPQLKMLAAFFAPQAAYTLTGGYERPPSRLQVISNVLLALRDQRQEVRGAFTVTPEHDRLFEIQFTAPTGWHVSEVTNANGQPLVFEARTEMNGSRIRVRLPQGAPAGSPFSINFVAAATPPGWLAAWEKTNVTFPVFAVLGADKDEGAIAIHSADDLRPTPDKLEQLVPIDDTEKSQFGLEGIATDLVYRYESQPYAGTFQMERRRPVTTARTFSFFQIQPEALLASYELHFDVQEASTTTLELFLPRDTPTELTIRGLDGVVVKEFNSQLVDEANEKSDRRWTVSLSEKRRGRIRLVVEFTKAVTWQTSSPRSQNGSGEEKKSEPASGAKNRFALPLIRASVSQYQSGLLAVEGDSELDIEASHDGKGDNAARKIDVGELAEADYQVGRRLIAAFGFVGSPPNVLIDVSRRPGYSLPTAIVERAELVTLAATSGAVVTAARFQLRTKESFLEVRLPIGAKLWSAYLDGKALSPQRDGESLLVSLPAEQAVAQRDLQIVYESVSGSFAFRGNVAAIAPRLLMRAEKGGKSFECPLADVRWYLRPPSGFRATRNHGTVFPDVSDNSPQTRDQFAARSSPWSQLAISVGDTITAVSLIGGQAKYSPYVLATSDSSAHYEYRHATPKSAPSAGFELHDYATGGIPPAADMPLAATAEPAPTTAVPAMNAAPAMPKSEAAAADPSVAPTKPQPDAKPALEGREQDGKKQDDRLMMLVETKPGSNLPGPGGDTRNLDDSGRAVAGEGGRPPGRPVAREDKAYIEQVDRLTRGNAVMWALEGVRSLPFDFSSYTNDPASLLAFESFGVEPRLDVSVIHQTRLGALGWSVGLLVFLFGLLKVNQDFRAKAKFIFVVLLLATILPIFVSSDGAIFEVCQCAFWAAWSLVLVYVVLMVARWMIRLVCLLGQRCLGWCARRCVKPTTNTSASMLLVAAMLFGATQATLAQPPNAPQNPIPAATKPLSFDDLFGGFLAPRAMPKIPQDAVVVPYDGSQDNGWLKAERMLVPYEKYVELWRLAYPGQTAPHERPPALFAWAGAQYEARLEGNDFLEIVGKLQLDVFTEDAVDVPLVLAGGVLSVAKVDGQPARLKMVAATPAPAPPLPVQPQPPVQQLPAKGKPAQQAQVVNAPPSLPAAVPVLVVSTVGKGRKQLELTLRMKLERRGGWRIVEGQIPIAAATALSLVVPEAKTEVRLVSVVDRARFETEKADERIETALAPDQSLSLQWRPKVAEGDVDQRLTAMSTADFEVRDDALRLLWRVKLDFPRGRRDSFTLAAPRDFLIEKVSGLNVRGWKSEVDGERQKIEVTLLKTAAESETLHLALSRRGRVGGVADAANPDAVKPDAALTEFPLPAVVVPDSVLHQGTITIRRSPLLDVRIDKLVGLARTDLPPAQAANEYEEQSILVSRAFQAFRFSNISYSATIAASEQSFAASAHWQSLLRITDREAKLESLVTMRPAARGLHRVRVKIPGTLRVDAVSVRGGVATELHWAVADEPGQRWLTVLLGTGQSGPFSLLIEGSLGKRSPADPLALPVLAVADAKQQDGEIVVQAAPAVVVSADDLRNADAVPLSAETLATPRFGWLNPAQRELARLAVRFRDADHAGTLKFARRSPRVSSYTVTNIRVTRRAIEETIGLHFKVEDAGIRELSFVLPKSMRDARVNARLLRRSIVEDAADGVRFKLEFQDEVMGELRVVAQQDRLLTSETHAVPFPVVETGRTDQRLVSLESAGFGEVVFDKSEGVEPLSPQQQPWRKLAELFGTNITAAYAAREEVRQPQLTYRTKERSVIDTVAARIGMAETELRVDQNGAYRAKVTYRVDNSTEQFLVIELPEKAELWTARVAGEPVKPTTVPNGGAGQIRVPLVKTAPGDPDYEVVLTYAGQLPPLGSWTKVKFPFIKTVNINVELSLVQLHLPKTHRWFNFGGSMTPLDDKDYRASFAEYLQMQISQLQRVLSTNPNELTLLRCASNLQLLRDTKQQFDNANSSQLMSNDLYTRNNAANEQALRQLDEQLQVQKLAQQDAEVQLDNRARLNVAVEQQTLERGQGKLSKLGGNFDDFRGQDAAAKAPQNGEPSFNSKFLSSNQLQNAPEKPMEQTGRFADRSKQTSGKPMSSVERQFGDQKGQGQPMNQSAGGKNFNDAANPQFRKQLEAFEQKELDGLKQSPRQNDEGRDLNSRYGMRLAEQRAAQQAQQTLAVPQQAQPQFQGLNSGLGGGGQAPATKTTSEALNLRQEEELKKSIDEVSKGKKDAVVNSLSDGGGANARRGLAEGFLADGIAREELSPSTHLVSLDVELPNRGEQFFFKTPRGELEITAQSVHQPLVNRLWRLLWAVLGAAVLWFIARGRWSRETQPSLTR